MQKGIEIRFSSLFLLNGVNIVVSLKTTVWKTIN